MGLSEKILVKGFVKMVDSLDARYCMLDKLDKLDILDRLNSPETRYSISQVIPKPITPAKRIKPLNQRSVLNPTNTTPNPKQNNKLQTTNITFLNRPQFSYHSTASEPYSAPQACRYFSYNPQIHFFESMLFSVAVKYFPKSNHHNTHFSF